jgi:hypothetical protein
MVEQQEGTIFLDCYLFDWPYSLSFVSCPLSPFFEKGYVMKRVTLLAQGYRSSQFIALPFDSKALQIDFDASAVQIRFSSTFQQDLDSYNCTKNFSGEEVICY